MIELIIGFGIALLIFSIMDVKFKAIPSVILTTCLFLLLIIRFENLKYGVLAGVFAILIYELTYSNKHQFGMADIKVMIMIGLLISTFSGFIVYLVTFGFIQLMYIIYCNYMLNKKDGDLPFIPMFLALYIGLAVGGIVA